MTIIAHPYVTAMRDQNIAAADYGESWAGWWVAHSALDAQPPPVVEVPHWRDIWETISGGREWPTVRPREWHLYGSRRISKTRESARRGGWACVTFDPQRLSRGERGVFQFYAPDRAQASIAFEYAVAFVEGSPLLRQMIAEPPTKTELRFINRTVMRVATANFRTARGWTSIGAHNDESAFMWDGEQSANPIGELFASQRPAMGTIPTAQLSSATTPRARIGEVWKLFDRFFGKNDPRVLVLRADHTFNPTLDTAIVQAALDEDESIARAEYFAEFRRDIESFVSREVLDACTIPHRVELPPSGEVQYVGFVDPSGGGGADSFSAAIAHVERECTVLDAVREFRPPLSPAAVVAELAVFFREYHCTTVHGDAYGGSWPAERFGEHGLTYRLASKTRSELYATLLPLLTSGQVALLDNARLHAQCVSLERRTGRVRDAIDHPPRQHDDLINAAAGAIVTAHEQNRHCIIVPPGGSEAPSVWGRF